ncbi:MAG TPA: metalloregulator ArsR/SmtB family transcription factor [Actinomycetota bacterium]
MKAIAAPRRQEILRLVWNQERAAGDIAQHFDVSRPAISKHLRILREAGLVDERRKGTQRLYSARAESLLELRRFLDSFWDQGLQAIKQAAEAGSGAVERG